MGRISIANSSNDQRFGLFVGDGHEIGTTFQLNVLLAIHIVFQHTAGITRQLYSKIRIFHYLFWLLDVVFEAIRSSTLVKPSSSARTANAGSIRILSKSENPSSSALLR